MSNLLDLSAKIDPRSVALFAAVSEAAGSLGLPFFVVGATARDMIFELGHGFPSKRGTLDRDFGVRVSSWAEFEKLRTLTTFEQVPDCWAVIWQKSEAQTHSGGSGKYSQRK
jgi:predicted nucleotidyltransferase